jgi:hypothetical protein
MQLYLPPEAQNGGYVVRGRKGEIVLGGGDFDADLDAVENFIAELDE